MEKFRKDTFLARFNTGQEKAFMEVYDFYLPSIFRFVYYQARQNKSVAEDLTQKAFMKIWEYVSGDNKPIENIQAFLYRGARNLVIDHWRALEKEHLPILEEHNDLPDDTQDVAAAIDTQLSLENVVSALDDIPSQYKEVVIMRFIEELDVKEIAEVLGKDKNAVYVLIHRALKSLRDLITNN